MKVFNLTYQVTRTRRTIFAVMVVTLLTGAGLWGAISVSANHPVLVEGNCNNPPAGNSAPPTGTPGTCGDYDGDGRIGIAEDNDERFHDCGLPGLALAKSGSGEVNLPCVEE